MRFSSAHLLVAGIAVVGAIYLAEDGRGERPRAYRHRLPDGGERLSA